MAPPQDTYGAVRSLLQTLDLPLELLENHLQLTGDPHSVLPSSFNLGVVAQASVAASGLSSTLFHTLRTGERQNVTVNARHAALEFRECHSEAYYSINGNLPGGLWDELAGMYPTKDASFVRIHTNFPHHRAGILSILGLPSTASRDAVAKALLLWDSKEFEAEAARKGMCATAMRSFEEWCQHPHAKASRGAPPVQLIKIAEAPKRPRSALGVVNRALSGIRVLDLTRVLAGPICGRTLAAHGADVLLITSSKLPDLPNLDADTSRGKRTTQLDLTTPGDRETLWSLARESDVFLQGYRPGGLSEKGFNPGELARARPGIVCANLCAWGWEGPWKGNRGFDSLVQTATGFNVDEAKVFSDFNGDFDIRVAPKPFPLQALDHAAAYLLAYGITAALCRTVLEGGSWEVRVSLAGVGNWVRSLGRIGPDGFKNVLPKSIYPPTEEISELSTELHIADGKQDNHKAGESAPRRGTMLALKHSAILEKTPVVERAAPVRLDVHLPVWLPRE